MTRKILLLAALLALLALAAGAADDKTSTLKIQVVKDSNGQPIRNASVVLHQVDEKGKQEKGGFQLKTNEEGRTEYAGAPYGKMRVQVIAHGFQTFGDDYDVNQPDQEVVIKLKRPQQQYTIYDDKKKDDKPKQ